jgi:hypothetical protein
VAGAWAASIFATSSTFIEREAFLRWMARVLPAGPVYGAFSWFYHRFGLLLVKGWHVTEFAVLFLLLWWTACSGLRLAVPRASAIAAVAAALYAVSDEWHQTFVPGRGGTATDVAIDCCGIALAAWAVLGFSQRRRRLAVEYTAVPEKSVA